MLNALCLWAQEKAQDDKRQAEIGLEHCENTLVKYVTLYLKYGDEYLYNIHTLIDLRRKYKERIKFINNVLMDIHQLELNYRYKNHL